MKALILPLLILLASPAAHASLASDMKAIGAIVKKLTADVADPAKNAASAASAKQLGALFVSSQAHVPDAITALPSDQRPKAIADYKALLQTEVDLAAELERAFLNNNNASAATILKDMGPPKTEGHRKYK